MEEVERRQLKLESVRRAWLSDEAYRIQQQRSFAPRVERANEAMQILDDLRSTLDADAFRTAIQGWAHRPGYESFEGFGAMFLHQLVSYTEDSATAAQLLVECLSLPASEDEAAAKIRRCVAHIDNIKRAGQPAPKRAPFVLSLFWSMADQNNWPCLWMSADRMLTALGWLTSSGDLDQWYLTYRDIVMSSKMTPFEVESILYWMDEKHLFTGLDPALVDRCRENVELAEGFRVAGAYPSPGVAATAERNARAIIGELKLAGTQLDERVGNALGRAVTPRLTLILQ